MRLLLDTHVLIWWLRDDARLAPKPRALIADRRTSALFSIVSCWEASIKARICKMDIAGTELCRIAIGQGLQMIGVAPAHLEAFDALPHVPGHRDPFDQLLLAQAGAEKAALMTHDRSLPAYGIRCIGVR
jgi:PIN domain nuclease of toxin-antitoxin system